MKRRRKRNLEIVLSFQLKRKKKIDAHSRFDPTKRNNFSKEKRLVFLQEARERKKSIRFRVAKINDEKLNGKKGKERGRQREKRKEKRI